MATVMHIGIWLATIALIILLIRKRFPEIWEKKPALATTGSPPNTGAPAPSTNPPPASSSFAGSLVDAFTNPSTWGWWLFIVFVAWVTSPAIFNAQNWAWVPIAAWMLTAFFSRAKSASLQNSAQSGKDKKAHPALAGATKHFERIAILSTVGLIGYYSFVAPEGAWEKIAGKRSAEVRQGPNKMVIPKGVSTNPNFTSRQLAHWDVFYVAANPQYRVPQAAWGGKKVALLQEPGREVTEVVNLTVGFGQGNEALDIHLSGACQAIRDRQKPGTSKTCVGSWQDRGSQISGKFYLEVKEGSNQYFDAYLYDGNYLPKERNLARLILSGPPIPDIMLQFRP